jgi:hypothetical protein
VKLLLYARQGIPEVWIVDLAAEAVEWFRRPAGEGYAENGHAIRGQTLTPALLSDAAVPGYRYPGLSAYATIAGCALITAAEA